MFQSTLFDPKYRKILEGKGINPDEVTQIAEAVHSGGTDSFDPMDLDAKKRVIDSYNARTTLVIVSTSLLEQSFNNLITSAVIDTVPRKTFVGVGQRGMRALRPYEDKLSFIVNIQDFDYPSITFTEFHASRGREEGLEMMFGGCTGSVAGSPSIDEGALYEVVYGMALVDIVEEKRKVKFYSDDYTNGGHRHFTEEGYRQLNQLMKDMREISPESDSIRFKQTVNDFLSAIDVWVNRVADNIKKNTPQSERVRKLQDPREFISETLVKALEYVQEGKILLWHAFAVNVTNQIIHKYTVKANMRHYQDQQVSWEEYVNLSTEENMVIEDVSRRELKERIDWVLDNTFQPSEFEDFLFSGQLNQFLDEILKNPNAHERVLEHLKNIFLKPESVDVHSEKFRRDLEKHYHGAANVIADLSQFGEVKDILLAHFKGNSRSAIIRMKLEAPDMSYSKMGEEIERTAETVRLIYEKAIRKMEHRIRSRHLEGFIDR